MHQNIKTELLLDLYPFRDPLPEKALILLRAELPAPSASPHLSELLRLRKRADRRRRKKRKPELCLLKLLSLRKIGLSHIVLGMDAGASPPDLSVGFSLSPGKKCPVLSQRFLTSRLSLRELRKLPELGELLLRKGKMLFIVL